MSVDSSKISASSSEPRRPKGQSSRTTILLAATKLATMKGLTGLSLNDLAAEVKMSKSGLYAHFKSKEELELATIEMAAVIFAGEVLQPAMNAPAGTKRLKVLVNLFLSHLERRVFPGGCFFFRRCRRTRHTTRFGTRSSRRGTWQLSRIIEAVYPGSARPQRDRSPCRSCSAVFEIQAMLLAANLLFVMMNDPIHLTQGCRGIENVLARLAISTKSK